MPYNILYWWFFHEQNDLGHSKIRRSKPRLLMFASLVALDGFHLLLSTQLTVDLTLEWSDWSMRLPLAYIYVKKFFFSLKELQTTLWVDDALLFLIDCKKTRHPLWIPLSHWQMFMLNGEYAAFWYLQLLCYLTQLQFTIDQKEFVEFFGVFRDNYQIWATWAFSIIYVLKSTFKVSIINIIIIVSCHRHGYPWPSLATSPYRSSPLAGLQGYIPYPHIAAVRMFEMVV